MKRLFLMTVVLLLSLQNQHPANAQENEIKISTMKISLMPEYDKPEVLVIYRGRVSSEVELPALIKFNIFPGVEPHVASVTPTGSHIHDPFEVKSADGDSYAEFTLREREFQLEYYFNPFAPKAKQKSFNYSYKSYYAIANFSYEVQQPLGSSSFTTSPASFRSNSDDKGIIHHQVLAGSMAAGETKAVSVSYFKPDNETSLQKSEHKEDGIGVYGIISITVLIVLVGLLIYAYISKTTRGRGKIQRAGAKRMKNVRKKEKITSNEGTRPQSEKIDFISGKVPRFCTNCGERVNPEAKFCGNCGNAQED